MTRRFGPKTAVDGLDLEIEPGVIYGFLGPNGCGKTTAMRMLTGLLTPSEGSARVLGVELPGRAEPLKRKIGYMTQSFSHYRDLTVAENMGFTASVYGLRGRKARARIGELTEEYDLAGLAAQMAGSLSGGQKQRLALALAVMHRPRLLFLDEPTSAVDPESRRGFWEKLFDLVAEGASIVVSTHFMDEAERCHRLAILDRGRKRADGTPQELMDALGVTVLEVEGTDLRAARRRLDGAAGILSAAQIGARLRVLVEGDVPEPEARLREAAGLGDGAAIARTRPNLEDVFVSATREQAA
nr:ABC transporter ATP-binding protein [Mangrovicoccus sp. HB161399]